MGFPLAGGGVLRAWDLADNASHGYIVEFDQHHAEIEGQLRQMYANGQRRLAFAIHHTEGGQNPTLDCTGGKFAIPQQRTNLINLINLAGEIGFAEFVCEMLPLWRIAPNEWMNPVVMGSDARLWHALEYMAGFEFLMETERAFQEGAAGRQVVYDLYAEPDLPNPSVMEACQRRWRDWVAMHYRTSDPTGHSCGFSIAPFPQNLALIPKIYGDLQLPWFFNFHVGGGSLRPDSTPSEDWQNIKDSLTAMGIMRLCVIGESKANNAACAATFAGDQSVAWVNRYPYDDGTPKDSPQDRLTIVCDQWTSRGL